MNRSEVALGMFEQDFNCAQSIFSAFANQTILDPQVALKIAAPFGAGFGRLGETCGAVTGALMVIGSYFGYSNAQDQFGKETVYTLARSFCEKFQARNHSILCRKLIGYDLRKENELILARSQGVFAALCPNLVKDAAEILEELLVEL